MPEVCGLLAVGDADKKRRIAAVMDERMSRVLSEVDPQSALAVRLRVRLAAEHHLRAGGLVRPTSPPSR
ncbi:hypothetical protein [Kribbella sp. NBC_00359]|uniref:hypothetical protein n=1 Tax=Kribbella sp. NBC_00359 TaxID=2975966 RepID=UPI002E21F2DE